MAIKYKTSEEIQTLREGGRIHAQILKEVGKRVKVGVKTSDLDSYAASLLDAAGATAAFLGYTPKGISYPYPASICISVNEEIVHGIPSDDKVLQEGDIVTLDLGVNYNGMITDAAITLPVGKIDEDSKLLLKANREALDAAIAAIKPGGHIGDIGAAVMKVADKYGLNIPEDLSGHGVGYSVHEEPFVPNEAEAGEGPEFKEGMVLAIEPMLTLGGKGIECLDDEYTYITVDGSRSSQFEHTVAITKKGAEILTKL
jgi:methionyl aminopeptidase